jgi:uncharacterized protein YndB with AHSA1/START domain
MMHMFGDTGTLTKDGAVNVITFRRSLNAPPERVWEALTTKDGITSWLAVSAKVDGRKGGAVEIEFDADQTVDGTITQWDPTDHFAHTWVINREIPSDVQYTLTPIDQGTELTLVHSGLPDEMCGGYTPGWHAYLARLATSLEGDAVPDWLTVFEAVAPAYQ